jgi:hypothetical protein
LNFKILFQGIFCENSRKILGRKTGRFPGQKSPQNSVEKNPQFYPKPARISNYKNFTKRIAIVDKNWRKNKKRNFFSFNR